MATKKIEQQPEQKEAVRLLLVEDNELAQLIIQRRLTADGYEVALSDSGRGAIALLQQDSPHVILLDLMMPEMDGEETLCRIRQMGNFTPIIIVSAAINRDNLARLQDLGADGFIVKPIDFERLKEEIQRVIETSQERLRQQVDEVLTVKENAEEEPTGELEDEPEAKPQDSD